MLMSHQRLSTDAALEGARAGVRCRRRHLSEEHTHDDQSSTIDATDSFARHVSGELQLSIDTVDTPARRYGSDVHKQVYIYGVLDRGPTELHRRFGMAWGVGGWLLTPFLGKLGVEGMIRLRQRVIDELTTTFASHYTDEVSLSGALDLEAITSYARQATGQKFLICPQR
jgi:NADPH2:quinone reductase